MHTEETSGIPPQELTKYNRRSGKSTLRFMGGLIALIAVLTIIALLQIF